jgi:hypothetical protein
MSWLKTITRIARFVLLVAIGLVLWMFGLVALDVPVGLPYWRHIAGAVLIVLAVNLFQEA